MSGDYSKDGRLFLATNPWALAAEAKRRGYDTDCFRESDLVPDGQMLILDLDKILALPERFDFDA